MSRGLRQSLLGLAALAIVVVAVVAVWPPAPPEPGEIAWNRHARGPVDSLRVIWVGHSLLNARDDHRPNAENVLEKIASFARARGDAYESFDHTLFGVPLSLLWRGRPHSYDRDEPQMREQRRELFASDDSWDAIVLTEGIPIDLSETREHSAYYLQRFYCALLADSPDARVYFYESWPHLQASDPDAHYGPVHQWRWEDEVELVRPVWDRIADQAATGSVVGPELEDRVKRFFGPVDGQCEHDTPIFAIPVASAMRALAIRLKEPHSWMLGPRSLAIEDLFVNPYEDWPADWPTDEALGDERVQQMLDGLRLRYEDEELDDVHPSDLGVYFASLVTYSVLYGKTPEGLPGPGSLTGLAQLQRFVWEHVHDDPRTGVR